MNFKKLVLIIFPKHLFRKINKMYLYIMKVPIYHTKTSDIISQEGNAESATVFVIKDGTYDETAKTVLGKLISALKIEDYNILVIKGDVFSTIHNDVNRLICFGYAPNELSANMSLPLYYFIPMESFKLIVSEDIGTMNATKEKKLKLWGELQKMFA